MRLLSTTDRPLQVRGDHGTFEGTNVMNNNLLLIGRWHGITRDQRNALRRSIDECGAGKLVFIITAAEQKNTRRHPLSIAERREVVSCLAEELGREFEIYAVNDISDSTKWVDHICEAVREQSNGNTILDSSNTILVSANPEVQKWFGEINFPSHSAQFDGAMPSDMLHAIRSGENWRKLATHSTLRLFNKFGVEKRVRDLFSELLVTEDGELSTGRDFVIYANGMDAGMKQKVDDIFPHIVPGLIGDMGCGTGTLMEYLSERYPSSEIVGVDLSRELLRMAESRHYPHHNVSVVKGNIIAVPFANSVVSTLIYSSVIHEIRSYNGYSTELVRETLRRSRGRLRVGGRIVIRDGIKPAPQKVWMKCDAQSEERFRRFAVDFKKKSDNPGVRFEERELESQKWFLLSMHEASEFLSKKDYLKNWDIEVNEEFGTFELHEWKEELEAAGYRVVEARSFLNEWIKTNRYDGKVWLHADLGDKPGELLPFPDTTCVIVGEKLALAPRIRNILRKHFGKLGLALRLFGTRRNVMPARKA